MAEIGFARRDGSWRWRGRRAAAPPAARRRPGNAFAALAKLKR